MPLLCLWRGCAAPGPFSNDKGLFEHLESAHNLAKPRFRCRWAGCARESELRGGMHGSMHLITHTNYRPFVCGRGGCKWAFAREDALKRHVVKVHGDSALRCEIEQGRILVVCQPGVDESAQKQAGHDEKRENDADGPDPETSKPHEESDAEQRLERIARLEAALAALEAKHSVEDEAQHDDDWVFYR